MKCPKAAPYAVAETAYGGTMCASAARLRELQKVFRNLPGAGQGAPPAAPPSQDLPGAGQEAGQGAGQPAAQGAPPDQAAAAGRELTGLTNELNRLLAVPPDRQTAAQQRRIAEILDRLKVLAQMPPQR
ncbi:MAG: hypothetical protein KGK33_16610 [Hyphomicrobiales bacterium]|nr:hypothetical protein [Hyphomicrobiales bacterium]MDE2286236.1 hypothetical protein [Hyphomicrobiales bacterium]